MNVKINGWDCQMSVREFAELAQTMQPAGTMPAEQKTAKRTGLRSVTAIRKLDGEHLYFRRLGDISAYFPELEGRRDLLAGIYSDDAKDYVRQQAIKIWQRLNPENRFAAFSRTDTDGNIITATIDKNGKCIDLKVEKDQ